MKRKPFLFCLTLCLTCCLLFPALLMPREDPWGNLKKIHFHDSVGNHSQVLTHLDQINPSGLKKTDKERIATELLRFGDHYFDKAKYDFAAAFYHKVLSFSPDNSYWYLYNKLEKIQQKEGQFFIGFDNLFKQLFGVLNNFEASFLVLHQFLELLFFAGMFTFLIYSIILFVRYFKLAGNDLAVDENGVISVKKLILLVVAIFWPAFMLSGWMIYPFLLSGLLWSYLTDNEQSALKYMLVVVAGLCLLYSFNQVLGQNVRTMEFQKVRQVYSGHLYEKNIHNGFDDRLKVIQAHYYYENGQYNTAMDLLLSTGENYKSVSKFILLGNIYFKDDELVQCIRNYREALKLDDQNGVALNNFALALIEENKPDVFRSYIERYPRIETYRSQTTGIRNMEISRKELWKRLVNFSGPHFQAGRFFSSLLQQLVVMPVPYYFLLFILYMMLPQRFLRHLGESTYCSKCSKVIKEASVHKSYKLCDECYQLFSIKDAIFLEAKILKEKELKNKFKSKFSYSLLLSLVIPGLNFIHREKNRLFLILAMVFYFLAGFSVVGMLNFNHLYSAAPLFLNFVGMCAVGFYVLVNVISVIGEQDGI